MKTCSSEDRVMVRHKKFARLFRNNGVRFGSRIHLYFPRTNLFAICFETPSSQTKEHQFVGFLKGNITHASRVADVCYEILKVGLNLDGSNADTWKCEIPDCMCRKNERKTV